MDIVTIVTAIATLVTSAVVLYKARDERKRIEAEREQIEACASETITRTAISLIEPLKLDITQARKKIEALEEERGALQDKMQSMQRKIQALFRRVRSLEAINRRLRVLVHSLLDGIRVLMEQIEDEEMVPMWCPPNEDYIEMVLQEQIGDLQETGGEDDSGDVEHGDGAM